MVADEDDEFFGYIHETNISHYEDDPIDQWLFRPAPHDHLYVFLLPAIAAVGIFVNLLTLCVYRHRDMRGLGTLFLRANLFVDSFYLACVIVIFVPLTWVHQMYKRKQYDEFWKYLSKLQTMVIISYPLANISKLLSQWYTLALVAEQFAAFYYPETLNKYSTVDQGSKLAVIICNTTILIHLVSFFKYFRKEVYIWQDFLSDLGTVTWKRYQVKVCCLSSIYRSNAFQTFEKYLYFVFCEIIPCALILILLVICIFAYRKLKRELQEVLPFPDVKLLRAFKNGRSVRTVLTIAGMFVCLQVVSYAMYILILPHLEFEQVLEHCQLLPWDRKYTVDTVDINWRNLYVFANIINACVKPWICIIVSYEFRSLIVSLWSWFWSNVHYYYRKMCGKGAPRTPSPQEEPSAEESEDYELDTNYEPNSTNDSVSYYDARSTPPSTPLISYSVKHFYDDQSSIFSTPVTSNMQP